VRVGLFGIGLDAYWPQFVSFEAKLKGYLDQAAARLTRPDVKVVNLGLIDTVGKAFEAGHRFRREEVDLIFTSCDYLCPVIDRAACRLTRRGTGGHPEPSADPDHR
jgi:L-arabinose isomerase